MNTAEMDSDLELDDNLDFDDGEEPVEDNLEAVEEEAVEGENVETDEEPEAEVDEEPEAEESEEPDDSVMVTLDGGEEVPLSELRASYFRNADYTQKTTEIAREREAAEKVKSLYSERIQVAQNTLRNLEGFLTSLIPPEPDFALAQSDPAAFTAQQAMRQRAIAELQGVVGMKGEIESHREQVRDEDMAAYKSEQDAALVKAMPHLKDEAKLAAFNANINKGALEFGFTEDEIAQTADARIRSALHYAIIGKRAEANRRNAARRVETPRKGKAKAAKQVANQNNQKAMQRLSKSGSIDDAMEIDFD